MEVSYKKLWKLLIDKDMKKKDLQATAGISWASRLCHENCKKNLKKVRNIKGFPCFFCIRML